MVLEAFRGLFFVGVRSRTAGDKLDAFFKTVVFSHIRNIAEMSNQLYSMYF